MTRRKRIEHTTQATQQHHAKHQREAQQLFSKELAPTEQMTLAKELVETRAAELCRAYKNVVSVSYGYRLRRRKDTDKPRVVRTPCVIFIVDKKWPAGEGNSDELIPRFLYIYAMVRGERRLCGIPTDVDEASNFSKIEPTAIQGIEVATETGGAIEPGSLACVIQRSSQPEATYMISCRHVFSLSETLHPEQRRSTVRLRNSRRALGTTLRVTGTLQDEPSFSFDAQLAEMTDAGALRAALNGVRFADYARSPDDFPPEYWILTPHGPVKAHFVQIISPSLPLSYHRAGITRVVHEELVVSHFATAERTVRGDSGSPIATTPAGGVLLGMHIAGSDQRTYAIPAWQLLCPANYQRAAPTETWSLINSDEVEVAPRIANVMDRADLLTGLTINHRYKNSVIWRLAPDGIRIADAPPEVTPGAPQTVGRVWRDFGSSITRWAAHFAVPIELILATICTESQGEPSAIRWEPDYVSDQATPHKIAVGLMQTRLSTAQEVLPDCRVTRQWLLDADNAIQAGTAYLAQQQPMTAFDPPKVACAYNAGSLRWNNAAGNRWKMRQFPRDTGEHVDRFVAWFNDCYRLFEQLGVSPSPSFRAML